jgi:NRAMP (natural resistance-associated macrophage protein)-like metal ion transporter
MGIEIGWLCTALAVHPGGTVFAQGNAPRQSNGTEQDSDMASPPRDVAHHKAVVATDPRGPREIALGRERNPFLRFLKILGPGLITGASDDDPSGIGTYATTGALLGYGILWTALVTYPLMASIQFVCAKIGMVSGRGLAGVLRQHYPRKLLYPVVGALVIANTINAGVDLGAIAAGCNLLVPAIPAVALVVPITVVLVVLQVWGSYRLIVRTFKWLTLALFAYIGSAFLARPDLGDLLRGTFLPTIRWDSRFLAALVAILGTTISPYLFFWQASQEVEEDVALGRKRLWQRRGTTDGELKYAALDVNVGMVLSNLVMYFILLATAATLHVQGQTEIPSAADAARALEPLAGPAAEVLMALGLIGSGFLAVPVLVTSGAYAVCETFAWKCGLDQKPERARRFYAIIAASMVLGMVINFAGINPINALFWTAVINGFLAPPLLVIILLVANNRAIMGSRVNGPWTNVPGWITVGLMTAAAVGLVLTWGQG